jgi:hypothetical protein
MRDAGLFGSMEREGAWPDGDQHHAQDEDEPQESERLAPRQYAQKSKPAHKPERRAAVVGFA